MKKRIFAFALAVLMLSMLLGTAVFAEGEQAIADTTLFWKVTDGTLDISGTGNMKDYSSYEEAPWKDETINEVTIGTGVTKIGANTIPPDCTTVTVPCTLQAQLPDTVTNKTPIHEINEINRVEPDYESEGNIHHWVCRNCNTPFSDAAGTQPITDRSTLILAKLTDTEAPTFVGLACNPTSIVPTAATTVNVTVNATDALSGVSSGSVIFRNLVKNVSIPEAALTVDNNGVLNGVLNFSNTMPSGQYYINSLTLKDTAGNTRTYSYAELSSLFPAYAAYCITVASRTAPIATAATLSLNANSIGYGGSVTGTVLLNSNGVAIPGVTFDIYAGSTSSGVTSMTKTGATATTDANGMATFTYTQSTPGTYALQAKFGGDSDYSACETSTVNLTVTNNPATGDSYDLMLWVCVGTLAIAGNIWFFRRQRMA